MSDGLVKKKIDTNSGQEGERLSKAQHDCGLWNTTRVRVDVIYFCIF